MEYTLWQMGTNSIWRNIFEEYFVQLSRLVLLIKEYKFDLPFIDSQWSLHIHKIMLLIKISLNDSGSTEDETMKCYTRLEGEEGVIESPSYPSSYPAGVDCKYDVVRASSSVCGLRVYGKFDHL